MNASRDNNYYDSHLHKLYEYHTSTNENNELKIQEQGDIRDLEVNWIGRLIDQISFANDHVLTKFHLSVKIQQIKVTYI